jgi:nicotinamide-nucleotide amidase
VTTSSVIRDLAERVGDEAQRRDLLLATAESLTGGQLAADLARAGGASEWFAGGFVAYSSDVKHALLDVPPGPVVSSPSAAAMAAKAAELLGADIAVAVTGVGGPDEQDGQPPGTVWFGLAVLGEVTTRLEHFAGSPEDVVAATRATALQRLHEALAGQPAGPRHR